MDMHLLVYNFIDVHMVCALVLMRSHVSLFKELVKPI